MAKFNYKSVKKAQRNKVEKVKAVEAQAGRPRARSMAKLKTTGLGATKKVNPSPQGEGPSKRERVELVLIATPSTIENHPVFLSMKERGLFSMRLTLFDVNKDVNHPGELVNEVEMYADEALTKSAQMTLCRVRKASLLQRDLLLVLPLLEYEELQQIGGFRVQSYHLNDHMLAVQGSGKAAMIRKDVEGSSALMVEGEVFLRSFGERQMFFSDLVEPSYGVFFYELLLKQ
ncbi:hypothetical protein JHK87_012508 [Glycine soja]|nr:hypothetical protein JHK87_012508 [Glycine soja]